MADPLLGRTLPASRVGTKGIPKQVAHVVVFNRQPVEQGQDLPVRMLLGQGRNSY